MTSKINLHFEIEHVFTYRKGMKRACRKGHAEKGMQKGHAEKGMQKGHEKGIAL